ncbi:MAG: UbiA family prenyltransferase [Spirosomataceae bacterium]
MNYNRPLTYLRNAHLLSLDVVLGAMLSHVMFVRWPNGKGEVSWVILCELAIGVFIVYTLDRLLDIHKGLVETPRHQFLKEHTSLLLKIVVGCTLVAVGLVFFLPSKIVWLGLSIVGVTSLYLWLLNRLSTTSGFHAQKEWIVAIIYTAGIWGSAALTREHISWIDWTVSALFLLIAFQNLLLFSWMEAIHADEANSLAIVWGDEVCRAVISALLVIVLVVAGVLLFFVEFPYQRRVLLLMPLMSGMLVYIRFHPQRFLVNDRYRWVGDGIFLVPLTLL